MVCFCYRRRFVALPRLSADGQFIRRPTTGCYQEARLFASGTVSLTTSHRRNTQAFRSALASACRKTMRSSGWIEITNSSPSRRIATFRLSGRLMTPVADIGAPH